jgi:2-iminobutanoate/2-iminopropanoate deaminase
MSRQALDAPGLAPPIGPFSHAVQAGETVYLSGQTGTDAKTNELVPGGVGAQTEQVFRNLGAVLKALGLGFDHVVKCNVYLTDMGDFAAMNTIYAKQFAQPYPARTTVAVAALPRGAQVEIELVARKG